MFRRASLLAIVALSVGCEQKPKVPPRPASEALEDRPISLPTPDPGRVAVRCEKIKSDPNESVWRWVIVGPRMWSKATHDGLGGVALEQIPMDSDATNATSVWKLDLTVKAQDLSDGHTSFGVVMNLQPMLEGTVGPKDLKRPELHQDSTTQTFYAPVVAIDQAVNIVASGDVMLDLPGELMLGTINIPGNDFIKPVSQTLTLRVKE